MDEKEQYELEAIHTFMQELSDSSFNNATSFHQTDGGLRVRLEGETDFFTVLDVTPFEYAFEYKGNVHSYFSVMNRNCKRSWHKCE